jgi:iron(III) transport system substrate-binding protein
MMRILRTLALSLLALLLVSSGFAQNQVVVYSTIFAGYQDDLKAAFEAANPGVTLEIINPGGTEAMLARAVAERDNPRSDVIHSGGSTEYDYAVSQDLLRPYVNPEAGVPQFLDIGGQQLPLRHPDGYWHVFTVMFTGIMVNTDRLAALGLPMPTSYADLADPVYRGHIISPNPLRSSTAVSNVLATYQIFGEDMWTMWDQIDANIDFYIDSTSNTYNLVARGEVPLALVVSRPVYELQAQGFPVEFIFPEDGTQVADNSMGIVVGAPNPELAERVIDFVLGMEMQALAAAHGYTPIRAGVVPAESPISLETLEAQIKRLILPDAELAEAVREEMQARFEAYLRNR